MDIEVYVNKVKQEPDPEVSEESDSPEILYVNFSLTS